MSRIAFAVRTLDLEHFPIDGKAMFYAFEDLDARVEAENRIKDAHGIGAFFAKRERKTEPTWNWSDFYMMALGDWDRRSGHLPERHGAPRGAEHVPVSIQLHRSGMEFAGESVRRLIVARKAALPFIDESAFFLVTKEEFRREFNVAFGEAQG